MAIHIFWNFSFSTVFQFDGFILVGLAINNINWIISF